MVQLCTVSVLDFEKLTSDTTTIDVMKAPNKTDKILCMA